MSNFNFTLGNSNSGDSSDEELSFNDRRTLHQATGVPDDIQAQLRYLLGEYRRVQARQEEYEGRLRDLSALYAAQQSVQPAAPVVSAPTAPAVRAYTGEEIKHAKDLIHQKLESLANEESPREFDLGVYFNRAPNNQLATEVVNWVCGRPSCQVDKKTVREKVHNIFRSRRDDARMSEQRKEEQNDDKRRYQRVREKHDARCQSYADNVDLLEAEGSPFQGGSALLARECMSPELTDGEADGSDKVVNVYKVGYRSQQAVQYFKKLDQLTAVRKLATGRRQPAGSRRRRSDSNDNGNSVEEGRNVRRRVGTGRGSATGRIERRPVDLECDFVLTPELASRLPSWAVRRPQQQ